MRTLLLIIMTFSATIIMGQKSVEWIGGTPGKETCWNEPRNWSDHKVPNEFSNVFIGKTSASVVHFPVISEGLIELNSINLSNQATLKLDASAELIIYDSATGIFSNNFVADGRVVMVEEALGHNESIVVVNN